MRKRKRGAKPNVKPGLQAKAEAERQLPTLHDELATAMGSSDERNRQAATALLITPVAPTWFERRVLLSGVIRCMVSVWHDSFRRPFVCMKRTSEP